MKSDFSGEARVGQCTGRDDDIVQFHVMSGALASEAYGVNGNVAGAQGADGVGTDAAGVVVAIAEQHHGADGQVGSLFAQLFEAFADAGRGLVRLQVLETVDTGGHVVDAVEARLKGTLEFVEDTVLKRVDDLGLAGGAIFGYGHAFGIVDQHGDDVLLRFQLGNGDCRLPQQDEDQRGQKGLQAPDHPGAPAANDPGAAWERRERIRKASPSAAARISTRSIHFGHTPRREIWPRV